MAVLQAAQLLDALMGKRRNLNPNDKNKKPNWEDPEYCKYYMVKFCPHDLFINTKADLGPCTKVHDDEVKDLFEKAEMTSKKDQNIKDFRRYCRNLIFDVEKKILRGKQRLELMNSKSEEPPMTQAQTEKNQEQVNMLSKKIASLIEEAEAAGTRGDVEEALGIMKLCDQLKEEKDQLVGQQENSNFSMTAKLAAAQEKHMELCTVCGAFLVVGNTQQPVEDHLTGKQHLGYIKLRQAYEEMVESRVKELQEKDKRRREEKERALRDSGGLGSDRRDREMIERDRERVRERDRDRHRSSREERSSRHDEKGKGEREDKSRIEKKSSRDDKDRDRERRRRERRSRDRSRDRHSRRSSRDRH